MRRAALAFVLGACTFAGRAASEERPLGTIAAVRALDTADAERHHPVRLDAIVTFYDAAWGLCFASDASGGTFVQLPGDVQLVAGQRVVIEGETRGGDYAPVVGASRVTPVGYVGLPAAKPLPAAELLDGRHDSEWIELTGVIRRSWSDGAHHDLDIVADGQRLQVTLPITEDGHALDALVGATVRVHAACGSIFNRKRQLVGVRLFVPRRVEIAVVAAAAADPFTAPLRDVNRLLAYASGASGQVRVRGVVTLDAHGGDLFIADRTGGLRVQSLAHSSFARGTEVEVVGYAGRDVFAASLEDAVVRPTGARREIVARPLDIEDAANGAESSNLVSANAELVEVGRRADGLTLVLKGAGHVFEAVLPSVETRTAAWDRGAQLQVTGIVVTEIDAHRRAKRFRLLLGSADDVRVLAAGPFWTGGRVITAFALLVAITLTVALWVVALRRRVHSQTRQIEARLSHEAALERRYSELFENASDIIFTLDSEWTFTEVNRAGERAFGYSRRELIGRNAIEMMADEHVERSRDAHRRKLAGLAQSTTYEVDVRIRDGRTITLEISSRLHDVPGGEPQIHAIARDVTERRRAAAELEAARRSAEAASRAKSDFLAMMSHELRTRSTGSSAWATCSRRRDSTSISATWCTRCRRARTRWSRSSATCSTSRRWKRASCGSTRCRSSWTAS